MVRDITISIQTLRLKELLIFDGNLVHAGGDNDNPNPRIFATFGRTYKALETRNYISMCEPCDFPKNCDVCITLGHMKNNHDDKKTHSRIGGQRIKVYLCFFGG